MLRFQKHKLHDFSLDVRDSNLLKWESVLVQEWCEVLSCVSGKGVGLRGSRLKHKKFKPRQLRVVVFLLNCCHLRILVAQRDEIPKWSHLDELGVKFTVNFFK